MDEAALDQAVTLLANAKRIEFLGVGGAGSWLTTAITSSYASAFR